VTQKKPEPAAAPHLAMIEKVRSMTPAQYKAFVLEVEESTERLALAEGATEGRALAARRAVRAGFAAVRKNTDQIGDTR
jgi:hypothetical protein